MLGPWHGRHVWCTWLHSTASTCSRWAASPMAPDSISATCFRFRKAFEATWKRYSSFSVFTTSLPGTFCLIRIRSYSGLCSPPLRSGQLSWVRKRIQAELPGWILWAQKWLAEGHLHLLPFTSTLSTANPDFSIKEFLHRNVIKCHRKQTQSEPMW